MAALSLKEEEYVIVLLGSKNVVNGIVEWALLLLMQTRI